MPSQTPVPVSELVALQRDVERLMSRFGALPEDAAPRWKPPIDVFATENEIVVRLEVPGMRAEDIQVTVTGGVLTLSGHREAPSEANLSSYVVRESPSGRFERQVSLPEGIDPSRVRATYRDGILDVRLPNMHGISRRQVPITREGATAPQGGGEQAPSAQPQGAVTQPGGSQPTEQAREHPHLFHGAEETAEGNEAAGTAGTSTDQAEPSDQGIYARPIGRGGAGLRYSGGHIPSQEEWLGRTSSEEESLDEAAEEEERGSTGRASGDLGWPTT